MIVRPNLLLYERLTRDANQFVADITRYAPNWVRSTRAIGGYWTGDFSIPPDTMTVHEMIAFYNANLGRRVVEMTGSIISWEGEIAEMDLTLGGVTYRRTLNPERWHNRVKVHYTDNSTSEPTATGWAENENSVNQYGESEYVDVVGDHYTSSSAEALRDRRLAENAYPIPVPVGAVSRAKRELGEPPSLRVICEGFVFSINRRYRESDTAAAAISTQITTLVGESEFVTAGSIDTNSDTVAISCSEVSTRLWDLIDEFIAMGDTSGNRWVGGVMAGRKFDYRQAETTVTHSWHNGRLYDKANVPVLPSMIKPDIIVHNSDAPKGETPPGGNLWSNPQNFYIEEVEFIYPDQYRLTPYRGV